MRKAPNCKIEKFRHPGPESQACSGTNAGAFMVPCKKTMLCCVVSDGRGWDHVSVHAADVNFNRIPTWEEMCFIKRLFFRDDEWAMQLHPPEKDYVNNHPFTLHLWRPQTPEERAAIEAEWGPEPGEQPGPIPLPDRIMV